MGRDTFSFVYSAKRAEDLVTAGSAAPQYEASAPKRERKSRYGSRPGGKRRGPSLAERIVANPDYAAAAHRGTLNGQEMSFSQAARTSEAYVTVRTALAIAAEKCGKCEKPLHECSGILKFMKDAT